MEIATSEQTPQLRHARSLLAALTAQPDLDALPAIEALATLDQVHPPLPPVDQPPPRATLDEALTALAAAAQTATDPREAARIAEAAAALHTPVPR